MPAFEFIWQRFRQYPRAAQWAIAAGVAIGAFLLWSDYVWAITVRWNERAAEILDEAREVVKSDQRVSKAIALQDTVRALGVVEKPNRQADSGDAVIDTVNEVLKKHRASKDNYSLKTPAKFRRGTLSDLLGSNERAGRLTADLRFTAAPADATAIIVELEGRPEIEAISSVRITRHTGSTPRVTVELLLDAWIITDEERSRRTGGVS